MNGLLPVKGNRNTYLTLACLVLACAVYVIRGVLAGDWAGWEWLMGALGINQAAAALRARGEYANNPEIFAAEELDDDE